MADVADELDALDAQMDGLEASLTSATQVAAAFQAEMGNVTSGLAVAGSQSTAFSGALSSKLRGAFSDLVFEGDKLSDVLTNLAKSMVASTFNQAITPVTDAISGALVNGIAGAFGGQAFAQGDAFSQGRVMPFARGGVVTSPTNFPMRGGYGLMGEAGPEAIMPLTRGADGRLGVQSQSGGAVQVTMNITTPDAKSFQRSKSQIAASMNRALSRGQRNT